MLNKLEIQKRVLKDGIPLELEKFEWDEDKKIFKSGVDGLCINFKGIDGCEIYCRNKCKIHCHNECEIYCHNECEINCYNNNKIFCLDNNKIFCRDKCKLIINSITYDLPAREYILTDYKNGTYKIIKKNELNVK